MNLMQNNLAKGISKGVAIAIAGLFVVFMATLLISYAPAAFAQTTTAPINDDAGGFVPCGNTADNPCQIGHLFSTFVVIINYLITLAGFIAVIAIVYAGFMMIYGQGNEQQTKEAKGRLSGAIIGLVLVAGAFVLINSLFAGSFSIGVRNGTSILTSPLDYIQDGKVGGSGTTPPKPPTNGGTKANTNTGK